MEEGTVRSVKLLRQIKVLLDRLMRDPGTNSEIRLNELYDHLRRDPLIHGELSTPVAVSQFLRAQHQDQLMKQIIPNYRVDTSDHRAYQWFFHRDTGIQQPH
jgi:hypothetical protein